eukprot:m.42246 g.42246  ORF g.42246 m.42246 type:complete len:122 (-) comp10664_c0_seq2:368-733(-)
MHGGLCTILFLNLSLERSIGPIMGDAYTRFKAPLTYPDNIAIGIRIAELEETQFKFRYEVHSEQLQRVAAEGSGVLVSYDFTTGKRAALPLDMLQAIALLQPNHDTVHQLISTHETPDKNV